MDITKAKEFLEKQGLDDCHYQDSGMIEHIAEQMEMYHAEQLRLGTVRRSCLFCQFYKHEEVGDSDFGAVYSDVATC